MEFFAQLEIGLEGNSTIELLWLFILLNCLIKSEFYDSNSTNKYIVGFTLKSGDRPINKSQNNLLFFDEITFWATFHMYPKDDRPRSFRCGIGRMGNTGGHHKSFPCSHHSIWQSFHHIHDRAFN